MKDVGSNNAAVYRNEVPVVVEIALTSNVLALRFEFRVQHNAEMPLDPIAEEVLRWLRVIVKTLRDKPFLLARIPPCRSPVTSDICNCRNHLGGRRTAFEI